MAKLQKIPRKKKEILAPAGRPDTYDAQIEKKGDYVLTAFITGRESKVDGNSLMECFDKLEKSNVVKGKCVLSVQKGELRSTMQLSPMKVKRLFMNKVFRTIIEKQLNLRLT